MTELSRTTFGYHARFKKTRPCGDPRRKIHSPAPVQTNQNPHAATNSSDQHTEYQRLHESPHTMMKKLTNSPAVILLAIIAVVIGYDAIGARGRFAAPTAVATVDLGRILEALDERSAKEADLNRFFDSLKGEAEPMQEALAALEEQIKNETNPPRRAELEEQFNLRQIQFASWNQVRAMQVDIEKSIMLRDLYKQIKEAVAELANVEGYDLILVDDSGGELGIDPNSQQSREAQILRQITRRRALYSADTIDITDEIIVRMNNAYKSRG